MIVASALPPYFMPMSHSKFPHCLRKPTFSGGKGNCNYAYGNNIFVKEDVEASKKWPYHHVPNSEESVRKTDDGVYDLFGGKVSPDGRVFKQSFAIRSYDVGCDAKASLRSLMQRLQEIVVQHSKSVGLLSGGFSSTPEMQKRGLVWVLRKLQIDVEQYPTWGDIIQIETCCYASADNGVIRDFVFRNHRTGEILARATSLNVLMNMHTRRLSKIEPDIRDEIKFAFMVGDPLIDIKNSKLRQMGVNAKSLVRVAGLAPSWTDLDINQHVSHVKYLDWVLQTLPPTVVEKNELSSMILEFRRECRMGDSNLQSFCAVVRSDGTSGQSTDKNGIEFDHLLLHEDGSTILRGRTIWKARGDGKAV